MARRVVLLAIVALAALPLPAAPAAEVVNGGFESGSLAGWQVRRSLEAGNWFPYKGTSPPIAKQRGDKVQAPPQGRFAAVSDAVTPDTLLLFQDLRLEPGSNYELSLLAYYDSYAAIDTPSPDTLSVTEEAIGSQGNQQFRIDLVKPEAPLESIASGDVLLNLFRTRPGAPRAMGPTRFAAQLKRFAGQTVRLRIAVAMTKEAFNAGVDAVSLSAAGEGSKLPPGARLRVGKARANPKNGTVSLPVRLPVAGRLEAAGLQRKIKRISVKAVRPRKLVLRLKPGPKGRVLLQRQGRMRTKVTLDWLPLTGGHETRRIPVVFKLRNP